MASCLGAENATTRRAVRACSGTARRGGSAGRRMAEHGPSGLLTPGADRICAASSSHLAAQGSGGPGRDGGAHGDGLHGCWAGGCCGGGCGAPLVGLQVILPCCAHSHEAPPCPIGPLRQLAHSWKHRASEAQAVPPPSAPYNPLASRPAPQPRPAGRIAPQQGVHGPPKARNNAGSGVRHSASSGGAVAAPAGGARHRQQRSGNARPGQQQ